MKIRNKKTGKITEIEKVNLVVKIGKRDCYESFAEYHSLAELNADWEDYVPAEPLIKDEKIRKAVRAWAEANDFLDEIEVHSLTAGTRFSIENYDIEFLGYFIYDLEGNKKYTIAELCGEEE